MKYLKKYNESIKYEDFENLIFDIKDLEYDLNDMDVELHIYPDPEKDPIRFNLLRMYLGHSLRNAPCLFRIELKINGSTSKMTTDECDNLLRIINHLKSIVNDFGFVISDLISMDRMNGYLLMQKGLTDIKFIIEKK
jgi:hypothetical protein